MDRNLFTRFIEIFEFKSRKYRFQRQHFRLNMFFGFACVFGLFLLQSAQAQTVDVRSTTTKIGETDRKGYAVCIELDRKSVLNFWQKTLKDTKGKVISEKGNVYRALNAQPSQFFNKPVNLSSKVEQTGNCMVVFLAGMDETEKPLEGSDDENVKKFLYEFAIQIYRNDVGDQIGQAEKVVDLSVKAQEKKVSEGKSLQHKLERSYKDRAKLLENLDENRFNTRKLKQDSVRNIAEQEQSLEEIKKVREVLEQKKSKLNQIE